MARRWVIRTLSLSTCKRKYGDLLDGDLSPADQAVALAFDRLIGEHLYYTGVLEPRWRMDEGFEVYIPHIVQSAEIGPELRACFDDFRKRVLAGFTGHGMGRWDSATVLTFYKTDIDAFSDFMANKKFLLEDKPRSVDASCCAILRYLIDRPQKWPGTRYVESKPNLVAYLERTKETLGF